MANVLINNQDTYINRSFIVSITKKSESDIFRIKMSNNDIYELESVSYKYFKNDKIKFDEPFDLSRYEKMGGRPYFLEKNKFIPYIPISGGGTGEPGEQGKPGDSAYQIWLNQGNTGTEEDFLNSLEGAPGDIGPIGPQGIPGEPGTPGESAYQIAVNNGYTGGEQDWLYDLNSFKNIKDDTIFRMWVGSYVEFNNITMDDNVLYTVYNESGVCEVKIKTDVQNVLTKPTLISEVFPDPSVSAYMKTKLSIGVDNLVTQELLDSINNFGGTENDMSNSTPSELSKGDKITTLEGVKYLRNIKTVNLNGVAYVDNNYVVDLSLNTRIESIENSFSNSNIGGVRLYGIDTIKLSEVR